MARWIDEQGRGVSGSVPISWERPGGYGYCCRYRLPDEHFHGTYEELLKCSGRATEKQAARALQAESARTGMRGRYQRAVDKPTAPPPSPEAPAMGVAEQKADTGLSEAPEVPCSCVGCREITTADEANERLLRSIWGQRKHRCDWCGQPLTRKDASVNHLTPRAWGGTDDPRNLSLVHKGICHDEVEAWTDDHNRPPSPDELKESRQNGGGIMEPRVRYERPEKARNLVHDFWDSFDNPSRANWP